MTEKSIDMREECQEENIYAENSTCNYGGRNRKSFLEKESSSLHRWEHVERLLWIIPSTMRWKPDLTK